MRQSRNWQRLWLGQAISLTGDSVFDVTILLWIGTVIARGKPWAPAAASAGLIAAAIPALVVGPFAGVFVDRWDRRRTMLVADAARAVLIAALVVVPLLGHRIPLGAQLGIVYAVVAAASCFAQFFDPSRIAIIGAIVPPADQARASGQLQAAMSFAQIIGPPIAAPLLFTLGVEWALILNAASFAASFLCIRAIRMPAVAPRPAERPGFAAEFLAGVRFFAGSKVLITLTAGVVIATLGTGALNALAVFFVHANLHVSASWLGAVVAAVGVGAVAGALLAGRIAAAIQPARAYWLGLVGCGVALIGFSRATILPAGLIIGILVGATLGVINSVLTPLLLGATPQHLIGRVSAVISPVQQLASILSMAAAGLLASTVLRGFHAVVGGLTFGPYDTVYLFAGLMFVIAGVASIAPLRDSVSGAAGSEGKPEDPAAVT